MKIFKRGVIVLGRKEASLLRLDCPAQRELAASVANKAIALAVQIKTTVEVYGPASAGSQLVNVYECPPDRGVDF